MNAMQVWKVQGSCGVMRCKACVGIGMCGKGGFVWWSSNTALPTPLPQHPPSTHYHNQPQHLTFPLPPPPPPHPTPEGRNQLLPPSLQHPPHLPPYHQFSPINCLPIAASPLFSNPPPPHKSPPLSPNLHHYPTPQNNQETPTSLHPTQKPLHT